MLVPAVVEVSLPVFVYRYLGSAMQDLLIASANKESPISFYVAQCVDCSVWNGEKCSCRLGTYLQLQLYNLPIAVCDQPYFFDELGSLMIRSNS